MSMPHLRSLDLNLLRVFVALLDEGSATRAGARLGLTQSAVSHALNRLRYGLNDELFVRGPSGMQPTARATEIAPRVRQGLAQLQAALAPAAFVPAETDRRFILAIGSYPGSVLLPDTMIAMRAQAPRATVQVRTAFAGAVEELDAGRVDLVVGVFGHTPERFDCLPLFRDGLVWAFRAGHPATRRPLTHEVLGGLSHVAVVAADTAGMVRGSVVEQGVERQAAVEDASLAQELAARGLQRNVALTLPDVHAALAVVARSDMTVAAPKGLVAVFGEALQVVAMDPPNPSAQREVLALWRKDNDGHALQWFLTLLRSAGERFMEARDGR